MLKLKTWVLFTLPFFLLLFSINVAVFADTTPPSSPVKLIFVHHSTGGNWLADSNIYGPYGELGKELMNNNYYVSATNYGWGPGGIGDNTDIPDWPTWFTGSQSTAILGQLYAETDQNVLDYGTWSRLAQDPGGENVIVMFKSCFPNSDLFGNPNDAAGTTTNDQFTVANAKAVYNKLLGYFVTKQDKLFVVTTAPPKIEADYNPDYQSAGHRAANARAFNSWLVHDWLDSYAYTNVAVFDYYNVLTAAENHHRISDGRIEHVINTDYNFAGYPSGDSHPSTQGHLKATTEFVPLLNYYYNRWMSADSPVGDGETDSDGGGNSTGGGSGGGAVDSAGGGGGGCLMGTLKQR